ncbi:hypothetical protein ACPA0F_07855 [Solibacillus silvestris]
MTLTYNACKNLINDGKYASVEDMQKKLDVFHEGGRISEAEHEELTEILKGK